MSLDARRVVKWGRAAVLLPLALGLGFSLQLAAQANVVITRGETAPQSLSQLPAAVDLSPAQRRALIDRYHARRESLDRLVNNNPVSAPGLESVGGKETQVEATLESETSEFHTPPASPSFVFGRRVKNPRVNFGFSLAETTAVNEGPHVFYMGNTHTEYTTNIGVNAFVNIPIPGGPAATPFVCCDPDAVYDKARGVTIYALLYLDGGVFSGAVRLFIRRQIPLANDCTYDYVPGAGIVPDYPHLGLSNNFLYLTTNNGFTHVIRRYNLDHLVDCVATPVTQVSVTPGVGQRVVVPVNGATDTIYWAYHESATVLRIWHWAETAGGPSSVLKAVDAHNHVNPDCRGGVNNTDWIERSTSYSITGFRTRGAVGGGKLGFWWNATPDASHNQAHVHAAIFRDISSLGFPLLAQPHIFKSDGCFGYPNVASNARGDFGIVVGFGGRAGGGGSAVRGHAGIDDDYTPGVGVFGTVFAFGSATHNPDGEEPRWGDYHSTKRHEPCDLAFTGTAYGHNGGTSSAFLDGRYVEFYRGRDHQCYIGWRDKERIP